MPRDRRVPVPSSSKGVFSTADLEYDPITRQFILFLDPSDAWNGYRMDEEALMQAIKEAKQK